MAEVEKAASTYELENAEKVKQVADTVHNDEALKVFANYTGDESWSDDEENKLRRKIDLKLIPVLCLTYTLQYYDKAMISQAVSQVLAGRVQRGHADRTLSGVVRFENGFGAHHWQPILLFRCYLLPWVHCWSIPSNGPCPAIPN